MNKLTAYAEKEFVDRAAEMEMRFTFVNDNSTTKRIRLYTHSQMKPKQYRETAFHLEE